MIKYKKRIDGVVRVRGDVETRHGKLRLDKNERVAPFSAEFMSQLLAGIDSEALCSYPETEGLYHQLAEFHQLRTENIMLTAGSDGAIRHCFDLCVEPGEKVIVLEPTFAMVDIYCQLYGARRVAIGYDAYLQLDTSKLLQAIGPTTALIVIANPNSPTGTLIAEADLEAILDRAASFGTVVLIDEAYYGFCEQTALPWIRHFSNLVVSRTFSKAYGLAGLRIGYLAADVELAQLFYRFRPMYEVNQVGLLAARLLLQSPEIAQRYIADTKEGRTYLIGELVAREIAYRDTHTNFIHVDFGRCKERALEAFAQAGVLVRGGLPVTGFEHYLRISLGPREVMARLVSMLDRLRE